MVYVYGRKHTYTHTNLYRMKTICIVKDKVFRKRCKTDTVGALDCDRLSASHKKILSLVVLVLVAAVDAKVTILFHRRRQQDLNLRPQRGTDF